MSQQKQTSLVFTELDKGGKIAHLTLNRPEQANAFSAQMMEEITQHAIHLSTLNDLRIVILSGSGKHFSAGADLAWMKQSAELSYEQNIEDAAKLRKMFESLVAIDCPKIAVVRGAVYGGALGLIACCDFAIADETSKFCLSEAKLGLVPAVIAPYLLRKMNPGQLRRMALTSRAFDVNDAKQFGLIEIISPDLGDSLYEEVKSLLSCGPEAQRSINRLFDSLRLKNYAQCDDTVQTIAKARSGQEGQEGLKSFFAKNAAAWVRSIKHSDIQDKI